MDQYIGRMLDNRYEILECIGTGGMAVVYKARCHRLNRLVAVKILKPELAQDAEFRRRFHDESQAVAMLSHTNIVGVYDVSHSDGVDYIVMELVDGMTLKQYMHKRAAPLNWREALHFITQIVRALGHAHSRGIIHRDIKPQNILVLRDGSVKVTDFGIARIASAAQATLTQEALGSVHYISPEQARGSHVDGRSDLYSAGVVLYEMLTGRLPFEGETPVSVAIQHINSIPIPPRDLNPSIPPALEAITLKAMAPRPELRYSSADEMLADLEEFRKNPDVIPEHARRTDDPFLNDSTRVVPVADIQREEMHSRRANQNGSDYGDAPVNRQRSHRGVEQQNDYEEEEEYEEESRRGKALPYVIAVLAILIFAGGMVFFVSRLFFGSDTVEAEEIEVPDLMAYTWAELQQDPSLYDGFTLDVQQEENEAEEGTIISQDPVGGTKLKKSADEDEADELVIKLVISSGDQQPLIIPDFAGQDGTEVMDQLTEMGLRPVSIGENSDVEKDHVIRTSPMANSSVMEGDTITVVISLGEEEVPVNVPNFVGMDIERAKRSVTQADLTIGDIQKEESDEPVNTVIWQSLTVNTEVAKGTKINFWVSAGPKETQSENPSASPSTAPSESPSTTPSESPSNAPSSAPPASETPDTQPSNSTAVPVSKSILVDLTGYSDKESVQVRVVVGGTEVENKTVRTSVGSYSVPASAIGPQRVEIYIDNELFSSETVDFS